MQVRCPGSKYLEVTGYSRKDGFWSPSDHVAGGMWKEWGVLRFITLSSLSHSLHTAQTSIISKIQHSDMI